MFSTRPFRCQPGVVLRAVLLVVGILALAGCSGGGPAAPAVTEGAPAPVAGTAGASRPTEVPGLPAASLHGRVGGSVAGALGTFVWDGLGSDSPWIVPPRALTATPGAPLAVTLDPGLEPQRWTARWAPVVAGSAGDPTAVASGVGAAIAVTAPASPGPWGLQVEISFTEGRRAAWYWSIRVSP